MTLSTTTSRAVYAGNGVTTIFSFPYRFLVNGDLEVTLFDADGVPDPQVLTTDYTVLGADLDAGGSVTMIVAPAVGQTLVIRRVVDLTQETDYNSGDAFPAETHERALDKLTMMDQQLQEQIDRSITVPLDNTTFSGQLPEIVPGNFVRINDAGTALEFVTALDPGDLVVSPYIETLLDDANAAAARTTLGAQAAGNYANSGAVGSSGLTMATSRVLGRVTASTGAIEELTLAQLVTFLSDYLVPAGKLGTFTGTTAPAGWLAVPLVATNISRTTYARLFAAIGTTWGVGDGSTTFGMPYCPADHVFVQANANVGTSTTGVVISHSHQTPGGTGSPSGGANNMTYGPGTANAGATTALTGGSANLPAGMRGLYMVKL